MMNRVALYCHFSTIAWWVLLELPHTVVTYSMWVEQGLATGDVACICLISHINTRFPRWFSGNCYSKVYSYVCSLQSVAMGLIIGTILCLLSGCSHTCLVEITIQSFSHSCNTTRSSCSELVSASVLPYSHPKIVYRCGSDWMVDR